MFDIHHNFIVKAKASVVFDAFCSPGGLDSWWTLQSAGEPVLGNIYSFYFGEPYNWRAEVAHVVTDKELTWRMVKTMDDWQGTTVGFELTEKEDSTHVHFFHHGWREASEHFGITNYCWGQLMHGLKMYVEKGIVIPHAQRN